MFAFNPFTGSFDITRPAPVAGTTAGTFAAGDDARFSQSPAALTQALDGAGFPITNFANGRTSADVALSTDASTAVLAQAIEGLGASRVVLATIGARVTVYTDANHAVGGGIDVVVDVSIATDVAGAATVTLTGTPIVDASRLPAAMSGTTATLAASAGGFTISATRKAGTAMHARARWSVWAFEDVTA